MGELNIVFATAEHIAMCQEISDTIAEAAKDKNSGLALRAPEYIRTKIEAGNGVIALDEGRFAGFCYIQPWEHGLFVAHSGLIVKPAYRGRGLATQLKRKAYELTRQKYPQAKIFGLTTSPAVKDINTSLGYSTVPYCQITADINFWKGCCSCVHYGTLCRNGFESCNCSAMLLDPDKQ